MKRSSYLLRADTEIWHTLTWRENDRIGPFQRMNVGFERVESELVGAGGLIPIRLGIALAAGMRAG
ncbi:MAG: hypothetical protein CME06_00450 [Gemmatimonadetes bacterium]|nr:hypothetical protein [Gemmatimonadota bacterium]